MVTALLILVSLVIVFALIGMVTLAINGDFFAQVWFFCGGAEALLKILAELIPAIIDGFSNSS